MPNPKQRKMRLFSTTKLFDKYHCTVILCLTLPVWGTGIGNLDMVLSWANSGNKQVFIY